MKVHLTIVLLSLAIFSCRSSHNRSKTLADQPASETVPQVDYPPMGCEKFGAKYRPMNLENKVSMGQDMDRENCEKALKLSTPEWICGKIGETRFFASVLDLYSRLDTTTGTLFAKGNFGSIEDCAKGIAPSNAPTL